MLYKIQHKPTGKFSTGGSRPKFTKYGKTWSNIGHIKNHIRMFKYKNWSTYDNCVIIAYEVVEAGIPEISLDEIIDDYKEEAVVATLQGKSHW